MKIYVISKKKSLVFCIAILLVIIGTIIYCNYDTTNVWKEETNEPIRNVDSNVKKMAFTCNVDWGTEEIPGILDILEKEHIHITFFVTGKWAKKNPDMLKLMDMKGHEIGNHGYSHKMHSKISRNENHSEIKKTEDEIVKVINKKPIYFAPPSGDHNKMTIQVASELGYKVILWSVDTVDWKKGSTKEVIINRVMKKEHKGAILLMHPKPATIEALPEIVAKIQGEGIKICTVSELIED
ncbi:divergent polysaccharide deacetylase family protein [Lutibacter sp. B2]|nr:divergent polysaccharide deacetylase family protein [Lutibacter sp. B2]